jgi:hypothetical protein
MTRTGSRASSAKSSSSDEEEDEDEEQEDEEQEDDEQEAQQGQEEKVSEEEKTEQFPLSAEFPTTPFKAAEYKAAKAVWHTQSTYVNDTVLTERLAQFAELFFPARDDWKAKNDALKQATDQKKSSATLSAEVQDRRQLIVATLKGTTEYGHLEILNGYVLPAFVLSQHEPSKPSIRYTRRYNTARLISCH